jgi:hypothetical protein
MNVRPIYRSVGYWLSAGCAMTTLACSGLEGPVGPTGPAGPSGSVPVFVSVSGTGSLVLNDTVFGYVQLPNLSTSVTVPTGSTYKLLVETDAGIQVNSISPSASCYTDVAVFLDGAQIGPVRRVFTANTSLIGYSVSSFGFSVQATASAGSHTVAVMAKQFPSIIGECYVSSGANGSGLPGNPRLQGTLNVIAFP